MHRGVENLMRLAGLSLADAIRMATLNPARAGKVPARTQGLVPGAPADIVQFRLTPSQAKSKSPPPGSPAAESSDPRVRIRRFRRQSARGADRVVDDNICVSIVM